MAESLAQLRGLSDAEVIRRYDYQAQTTQVGLRHWSDELNRRHQERQTNSMLVFTKWITRMTIAITVATLLNAGVAAGMLWVMMHE